jgi:hypothetical protein
MNVTVVPYEARWEPEVRAFNGRLGGQSGLVRFAFPERHLSEWLPARDDGRIHQAGFVAVEDGRTVRGGYMLRVQDFRIGGVRHTVGNLQLPLSEGVVDPRYRFLGVQLLRDALRRQPLLYSIGMGGLDQPYPRLLKGLGWSLWLIPFWFRVVHPGRFLRRLPLLRSSPLRRVAGGSLAWSGVGWLGARLVHAMAALRAGGIATRPLDSERVSEFGDWADEFWEEQRDGYGFAGVRDRATLAALFHTPCFPNLHFLRCTRRGCPVGWAVLGDSTMSGHRQFGDLRVGSLVDGFAAIEEVPAVVQAATRFLERRGVDLIVSNQSHHAWTAGLRAAGYLTGPSNYVLALSKELAALMSLGGLDWTDLHFNRGDGDGPINL